MNSAYQSEWLYNLAVIKETKRWMKHGFISSDQFNAIQNLYSVGFYHPNFLIRILLFVATLLALSGVTGLLVLMVDGADISKDGWSIAALIYGIVSWLVLESIFIKTNHHYKSGVTEALMYPSCGFIIVGLAGLFDDNEHVVLVSCVIIFSFAAIRYLDLLSTLAAIGSFVWLLFYESNNIGGLIQQLIPFVMIMLFLPLYFIAKRFKNTESAKPWHYVLLLTEAVALLIIYASGNYLVVRELSIEMMDLDLQPGQDIPFAFLFYAMTVIIPVVYLYVGVKNKDVVLLRVSLVVLAFSVFTFKYYFSLGHPEITLTIAGAAVTAIALLLLNYLKVVRNGYTRENLLTEKWGSANLQAILVSQTMGGNQPTVEQYGGEGGQFGGGGASGTF